MTFRKSLFAAAVVTALSLTGAAPALAAGFLKVPDIEGTAKKDFYKGWIELNSATAAVKPAASGRLIDNEGHAYLTAKIFGSPAISRNLKAAVAAKKKFAEVKADFVNDAGVVYLSVVMTDVVISSVTPGGSAAADDRPTEEVAFYYNRISFNYAAAADGKDGAKGGNVEFEWKVEEGES